MHINSQALSFNTYRYFGNYGATPVWNQMRLVIDGERDYKRACCVHLGREL